MTISMYQASIPSFIRALSNLSAILAKGAAYAEAKKIGPTVLAATRLYPNMLPLSSQVQIASDIAKNAAARLSGIDPPKFEDKETTLAELEARIAKTIDFLKTVNAEQLEGSETRAVTVKTPNGPLHFDGLGYLLGFVLPNVYFHVTTAYNILRQIGVEIGKTDYLGKA